MGWEQLWWGLVNGEEALRSVRIAFLRYLSQHLTLSAATPKI